jgi:hypothetical protein
MYSELIRTKICFDCKENKPTTDFYKRTVSPDGLGIYCKKCDNKKSNKYRLEKKNEIRIQRKKFRDSNKDHIRMQKFKSKFGISKEKYDNLLNAQNNKCAICNKGPETERYKRLALDHCHETGKIRGFLCNNCNRCIGLLGDKIENLVSAIKYLKKYKN